MMYNYLFYINVLIISVASILLACSVQKRPLIAPDDP